MDCVQSPDYGRVRRLPPITPFGKRVHATAARSAPAPFKPSQRQAAAMRAELLRYRKGL